jgi:hypothetical protein
MLPWHNAVIVWCPTVLVAADDNALSAPSLAAGSPASTTSAATA